MKNAIKIGDTVKIDAKVSIHGGMTGKVVAMLYGACGRLLAIRVAPNRTVDIHHRHCTKV